MYVYRTRLTIPVIQAHELAVAVPTSLKKSSSAFVREWHRLRKYRKSHRLTRDQKKVLGFRFSKLSEFRTRDEFFFSAVALNLLP